MATSYPHRIRLRGPWLLESHGPPGLNGRHRSVTGSEPKARRVTVPVRGGELTVAERAGAVILRRKFGVPRRLDDWERVRVVRDDMPTCRSSWRVNDVDLQWINAGGDDEPTSVYRPIVADVTSLLRERNELAVKFEGWTNDSESFGGAVLEIGCPAYVRHVRVRPQRVQGGWVLPTDVDVAGEHEAGPLELYALIDGRTVGYQVLPSTDREATECFALDENIIPGGSTARLRIDLVCGAVIWDTVEVQLALPD
jgi:hypothetical protein